MSDINKAMKLRNIAVQTAARFLMKNGYPVEFAVYLLARKR